MKKSALFYHYSGFLAFAACLSVLVPQSIDAQGFFTQTNHDDIGLSDARFGFSSGGYVLKLSYSNSVTEEFCAGYLSLNAEGQETDWSPGVCYPLEIGTTQMIWLPDDDILSVRASLAADTVMHVVKMHAGGDTVWHARVPRQLQLQYQPMAMKQNTAGEIIILGKVHGNPNPQGMEELFLFKFDTASNLLWRFEEPVFQGLPIMQAALATMPDGGCVYSLQMSNGYYMLNRITSAGDIAWSQQVDYFYDHLLTDETGNIFSLSSKIDSVLSTGFVKRNPEGQFLWEQNLNTVFQNVQTFPSTLIHAVNGDLLAVGYQWNNVQGANDVFFARFTSGGNFLWNKTYSFLNTADLPVYAGATPDNGFIMTGALSDNSHYVLKMGPNGEVYPGTLSGRLAIDANVNCQYDTPEQMLAGWQVCLAGDITLFATTDSAGMYLMENVPGGAYDLSAIPLSAVWESCPDALPVIIPDSGLATVSQDFSVQTLTDCPFMTIDLSTPFLRRCFSNIYTVHYCNNGSVAADSAFVDILLDPLFDFGGANIPVVQNGNHLHFPLGTVAALDCGNFQFTVTPNCDSAEIGQTLCISAAIFPDTICNPPLDWSGATLVGSATCESDSIRFTLRNIGDAPSTPALDFIVVDDHVIMLQAPLPSLDAGGQYIATAPANGSTWRFIAQQEPNHPGNESVSVGVEGCGGPLIPGLLLQFPNTDGNPFSARNCQEVVGSWDPNDKSTIPKGVGNEYFIEPGTPLTYRIRFQNTGTDTAFTVVLRDTLSPWLDPATLRTGAASHPHTFELSGAGVLTFTFSGIALPDSNINEAASHGFVQFSVGQRTGIPLGTVLENRAGIYFDFNPVVLTNTVWHTVDTGFLKIYVGTGEPRTGTGASLRVFPNPSANSVWLEWPEQLCTGGTVRLYDAFGKLILEKKATGQTVEIRRDALPSGIYWAEWSGKNGTKNRGKVVFR